MTLSVEDVLPLRLADVTFPDWHPLHGETGVVLAFALRHPTGLVLFQAIVQMDRKARHANADRVRTLHADHGPDSGASEVVTVFSAHDAIEYDALGDVMD